MEQQTSRPPIEISVSTTSFQVPLEEYVRDQPEEVPVVLFTGAGASVPLGMPAMREFRKQLTRETVGPTDRQSEAPMGQCRRTRGWLL